MKPQWVVQLNTDSFDSAKTMCQGKQIAAVVAAIESASPGLIWFTADMQGIGSTLLSSRSPTPLYVGEAGALIRLLIGVEQFESGVFAGCSPSRSEFRFREGGLWTEDERDADLGDALVEMRAFDATFIEVATSEKAIFEAVSRGQF